jgi:uncharacterized protein YbjT (DUF2867 family)
VVSEEGHDGSTYELSGPGAITLHELAEELSRLTGRTIATDTSNQLCTTLRALGPSGAA